MSKQQTLPSGELGAACVRRELAFNKAHAHCWAGAGSMERVWERRERPSHSSAWLASSTPPASDCPLRGVGTLHRKVSFPPYSDSLFLPLRRLHFTSCFASVKAFFPFFIPLMEAKLPGRRCSNMKTFVLLHVLTYRSCTFVFPRLNKVRKRRERNPPHSNAAFVCLQIIHAVRRATRLPTNQVWDNVRHAERSEKHHSGLHAFIWATAFLWD